MKKQNRNKSSESSRPGQLVRTSESDIAFSRELLEELSEGNPPDEALNFDEMPEASLAHPIRKQFGRITKKPFSIRLDADVLAWFKGQGEMYQRKINDALRAYMENTEATDRRADHDLDLHLLILAELVQREDHGYSLLARLRSKWPTEAGITEDEVYTKLFELEEDGLLTGRWEKLADGRRRIYRPNVKARLLLKSRGLVLRRFVDVVESLNRAFSGVQVSAR